MEMPKPYFLTAVLTLIRDKSICSSRRQLSNAGGWGQSHGKCKAVAPASAAAAFLCFRTEPHTLLLVSKAVISLTFCLFIFVWHLHLHKSQLSPLHLRIILNVWGLFLVWFNLIFFLIPSVQHSTMKGSMLHLGEGKQNQHHTSWHTC